MNHYSNKKKAMWEALPEQNMELNKFKQPLLNLIGNFLIGDYASWQFLDLSNFKWQKSRNSKKKQENSQSKKGKSMAIDTHARAWVKSVIWRLLGIAILGTISWVITKSWKEMTIITLLFHSIRVVLYYLHERLWERISWGRVKHPLSIFPVTKELKPEDLKLIQAQLSKLGYLD